MLSWKYLSKNTVKVSIALPGLYWKSREGQRIWRADGTNAIRKRKAKRTGLQVRR